MAYTPPTQYGNISPELLGQTQTSLGASLSGKLPSDVQNLLRQQAAEYGAGTGMPGSQFAGYRGLRNLGLTSLDQSNRAQGILAPFLTTPAQAQQLGMQGTSQQMQADQFSQQLSLADQRRADQLAIANQGASLEQQRINNQASQRAAELAAQSRSGQGAKPSQTGYGSPSPSQSYGYGSYSGPTSWESSAYQPSSYEQPSQSYGYSAPSYSTTPYYAAAPGSSYSPSSDPYGSYDTGIFDASYNSFGDYGSNYFSDVAPAGSGQYADYASDPYDYNW